MIGRIAWIAALLVVAVVAIFAQLDRATRSDSQLAALVPAAFGGFSAQRLSEQAIIAQNAPAAAQEARRLIAARPLPAEHMRLLSQASALQGDAPRSLAALEAASLRGWRDPVAQISAAQAALAQGQYDAAAQRIAALFAVGSMPDQTMALAGALLADPGGQAAFARQLATSTRWPSNVLVALADAVPPVRLAQTLALARAEGAALPCDKLAVVAQNYAAKGQDEAARLFWPGDC